MFSIVWKVLRIIYLTAVTLVKLMSYCSFWIFWTHCLLNEKSTSDKLSRVPVCIKNPNSRTINFLLIADKFNKGDGTFLSLQWGLFFFFRHRYTFPQLTDCVDFPRAHLSHTKNVRLDTSSLDTSSLPRLVIHDVSYLLITQNQNYMYDYYFKF